MKAEYIVAIFAVIALAVLAAYWRYTELQRQAAENTPGARIGRGIGDLVGGIVDIAS